MKLASLSLRLRVFLFFAFLGGAALAVIVAGAWFGYSRLDAPAPEVLSAFVLSSALAGFVILGLVAWVWYLFDEHVARAIQRLTGGMMAGAHSGVEDTISDDHGRYLGGLAPAAKAVTANLAETRSALRAAVERETEQLAEEKSRLEALLADVPEGVILCSAAHQVVLYNSAAFEMLDQEGQRPALNRPVFSVLREGPIRQAYVRLCRKEASRTTSVLCASAQSGRIFSASMRLIDVGGGEDGGTKPAPGYVLTFRDITGDLVAHEKREALLAELFDQLRRPAASLQTLMAALEGGEPAPARLRDAMAEEVGALTRNIAAFGERYDRGRAHWWPKGQHRAADLVDAIVAQLDHEGVTITADAERLLLRCDAYQIVALAVRLALGISRDHGATVLSLLIAAEETGGAMLTLGWAGSPLPVSLLEEWLGDQLDIGMAHATGRSVLDMHATEVWPEPGKAGRSILRLPILEAEAIVETAPAQPYRATYDFDIFRQDVSADLKERRLSDLTYVVFDTETTGLLPDEGDEIVQIAGLRLFNGRRIAGEEFDTLVNPGRSIPKASTEVHGVTEAMVADAEPISVIGRRFHHFAEGSVLVAHNAPFDMAFLMRHAPDMGVRFDNPVLDTVLLSAVVFGQSETHTLDAVCDRLGVVIPEPLRHTAMGDTVATAEAFLKMLQMLDAQGYKTFGDVLQAVRKHGRLLEDLNQMDLADM